MMLKFIGGMFLLVGTSIGAGILALPVTASPSGFIASSILLFGCWALMTVASLMILEVNLWFPQDSNMVSMARHTLGLPAEIIAWVTYLLLMYSLLCAYISGGADIFGSLMSLTGIQWPQWVSISLFTIIFGAVVTGGAMMTDHVNRWLMSIKLLTFVLLTSLIIPHTTSTYLHAGSAIHLPSTIMVMITAFGSATIVPTLRSYFQSDVRKLRKIIMFGSLLPLACYMAWDLAVLGTLPLEGNQGLLAVLNSGHVTSELLKALQNMVNRPVVTQLSRLFTSICVLTSFLGVALCLFDFLADSLKITKRGAGRFGISALTFLPPLILVIFFPGVCVRARTYAGICCVALLVLLPIAMIWYGTARRGKVAGLSVLASRPLLWSTLLSGLVVLGVGIVQTF